MANRQNRNPRSPTDIDKLVGANLRALRLKRNLTLAELAHAMSISHQQLQKYETGMNRLSAGMLSVAADTLGTRIEDLFHDPGAVPEKSPGPKARAIDQLRAEATYLLNRTKSEQLLKQMVQVLRALSA